MGDNIYISYWNSRIEEVIDRLKAGASIFTIDVSGLEKFGDRASYYSNFRIVKGELQIPKNAYAQGRDFHQVLINTDYFKQNLSDKTLSVKITKDLILEIEMEQNAVEFFKAEDLEFFTELHESDATYRKDNPQSVEKGKRVKETIFEKTNYWASLVAPHFPDFDYEEDNGWNISGNIKKYSWARLYLKGQRDKKYFVTMGVSSAETALVYKFDCQREGNNRLDEASIKKFDSFSSVNGRNWQEIDASHLEEYDWQKLKDETVDFVNKNLDAFKAIHNLLTPQSNNSGSAPIRPLNVILCGPPGTGKTYNSIDKAVQLAAPDKHTGQHKENKKVFDELRKEGQIEFVTFHQNYTYEDFIVGLKPELEANQLKFKRVEGVFLRLCKRAEQNYLASLNKSAGLKPFEEVLSQFLEPLHKGDEEIEIKMASGKASFWITDINPNNLSFRKQSGGTHHTLSIDTMKELYEGGREFTSGLRYYYVPLLEKLWLIGKQNQEKIDQKNYVLVIDEINRANISKVFGELITLLESDKRLGADNELRVAIPTSDKEFGVPPNLYVIGTMNTADKSIALVDIALRRRFEFIGMYPRYETIKDDIARKLLRDINKEVYEKKKSADYLIGHAYFINHSSINEVVLNKIIPLLMEYFMGRIDFVKQIFDKTDLKVSYSNETYQWVIE